MNVSPGQLARVRLLTGDCREVLKTLPAESVHCCGTSPPYFGLRDYGHAGQIGLEPTPAEYVEQMVAVFREVRRVLRDDGTLWLNLGDSYAAQRGGTTPPAETLAGGEHGQGPDDAKRGRKDGFNPSRHARGIGLKHKDLIGIPWRVAFALQADGWYLRQDIIWHKPNPMPESVRDRCTKAHEYLFLLAKSERYYFDSESMQEPSTGQIAGNTRPTKGAEEDPVKHRTRAGLHDFAQRQRTKRDSFKREDSKRAAAIPNQAAGTHRPDRDESEYPLETRNRRSVWTVATQPYRGAHFATFPPALIEPCIKAGCPEGGTVLDPFGGAGTTGLVADRLQRRAVLIELNPAYVELQRSRITEGAPLFASLEVLA